MYTFVLFFYKNVFILQTVVEEINKKNMPPFYKVSFLRAPFKCVNRSAFASWRFL